MPSGVKLLRFVMLFGGLAVFAGLYVYFFIEIWSADDIAPDLDKQLVYAASALGGVLGAFFAVSLGIQRKDPDANQSELKLGSTLVGGPSTVAAPLATAAVWIYAIVGAVAIVTATFKSVQSPEAVKALAATFGGYALAVFTAAFSATE